MPPIQQGDKILGMLLGATCLGALIYISGLSSTLRLGDASIRGFLLVPSLPLPFYVTMALVVLAGVGFTLLASFVQRRKRPSVLRPKRVHEPIRGAWQMGLSTLTGLGFLGLVVLLLMRHGAHVQRWLAEWRQDLGAAPGWLADGTRSLLRQVDSPVTGYALFITVMIIYGGLALLGLWVLREDREGRLAALEPEDLQTRRVRRAVTAGLRELQQHTDPRQAIIACYARLEHLLEDHGVPAYDHLTPQEYMGTALQHIDVPMDAFGGLVALFEQARYSLQPLDKTAKETAVTHLEAIKTHLEWGAALATRV
ncbi:hypothetical protein NKDENANG_01373 [Candidatus Entotheonellaceae bacterium PAL068K]